MATATRTRKRKRKNKAWTDSENQNLLQAGQDWKGSMGSFFESYAKETGRTQGAVRTHYYGLVSGNGNGKSSTKKATSSKPKRRSTKGRAKTRRRKATGRKRSTSRSSRSSQAKTPASVKAKNATGGNLPDFSAFSDTEVIKAAQSFRQELDRRKSVLKDLETLISP